MFVVTQVLYTLIPNAFLAVVSPNRLFGISITIDMVLAPSKYLQVSSSSVEFRITGRFKTFWSHSADHSVKLEEIKIKSILSWTCEQEKLHLLVVSTIAVFRNIYGT